jgi:hypothetical protein
LSEAPIAISDLSSLTRIQVETLKIHHAVLKGEISMDTALKMRINSGISRGAHYRIVAQGKRNIVRSLLTVATALQMGLLKPEDVQKLISTASIIPTDVDQDKVAEVMALVNLLAHRIVML